MSSDAARGPGESDEFRPTRAIGDALPTRAHAEMLFDLVVDLLGDAAWVESWGDGASRVLYRREAPGSPWIVPWPLVSVSRGGREGPSPVMTGIPGVYEEPKVRPGPAPNIRGLGPGQLTLHDGRHSLTVCYGADGRWFEFTVTHPREALAGVVPALAARSASPAELVAAFVAGIDLAGHGPARVHLPVPLPCGLDPVLRVGLDGVRDALFRDQVPADGRWAAADGWTGRAVGFGPTREAAVAAWRAEVERVRPYPSPPPADAPKFEMPDPPPESRIEQEFDGTHFSVRGMIFAQGPKSDVPSVEPSPATSPVVVTPVPEIPDVPPAFGGWVRTVDRWGGVHFAFVRREPRGCTLVGDLVPRQDLPALDARLDAADRAWDAFFDEHPLPKFELPPGFPPPPPTDTSTRSYRFLDERTRAPIEPQCMSAGRRAGIDGRGLDGDALRGQVVRMRRDG